MAIYERHTPENTLLYKAIARHWPGILRDYAERDVRIAPHVVSEFERFLRCGIFQCGFVLLACPICNEQRPVGWSCKCRGFCSPCGARRMEQKALRVETEVWRRQCPRLVVEHPLLRGKWSMCLSIELGGDDC